VPHDKENLTMKTTVATISAAILAVWLFWWPSHNAEFEKSCLAAGRKQFDPGGVFISNWHVMRLQESCVDPTKFQTKLQFLGPMEY
jgi:hypothetical protein